jgi:putative zinc finger/helix-turn-helix YgiT family protein
MIRCSVCGQGTLVEAHVEDHDISALAGLAQVVLVRAPALVCDRCGAATLSGEVIEAALASLTRVIVERREELAPEEVRFLRTELGMTQARLAERLGVDVGTIARWEASTEAPGRLHSLALRSLVAWTLIDKEPRLAPALSASFVREARSRVAPPYRVELSAA